MGDSFVGAGGWAYFNVPGLSPLKAYSRAFDYVEVNSTFYDIPSLKEAEGWRRAVPESFRFTVRAHRSITHGRPFEDTPIIHGNFNKMLEVCRALRAEVLHFQIPSSKVSGKGLTESLANFLDSAGTGRLLLALELRTTGHQQTPPSLIRLMQDRGMIHSVDLIKGERPAYDSDTLYARLFGRGNHNLYQPLDEELRETEGFSSGFSRAYLTFHGARMYSDAARMKIYRKTGQFPMVTKGIGLDSLREVLAEDAKFPLTKEELSRQQGWRLYDQSEEKRSRAEDALRLLPDGRYESLDAVIRSLGKIGDGNVR